MRNVPIHFKVLSRTPGLRQAVLTAESGKRLVLTSPEPAAAGSLIETEVRETIVFGEVVRCVPVEDQFELWVEVHHSLRSSWEPHSDWRGVEAPDSVLDSLCALNAHLKRPPATGRVKARIAVRAQ